ncbi:unnamed protein product, partial [Didymodactylos carnosus]
MNDCVKNQLLSESEIRSKVQELAVSIERDACGRPIIFIVVLNGAFIFAADLIRCIHGDNIQLDTVSLSSYKDGMISTEVVELRKDIDLNLNDQYVVIIEDILDTG